jgi:choline dehydrogenase-like flavoprotein
MIIDSHDLPDGKTITSDICIVGAGVAGIALANEFLNLPYTVTIIESGGLEPNIRTQSLNMGKNIGVPYYELDQSRTRAFGGTSHHWCCELGGPQLGVRLIGLDEIDFEKREWVPNSGWPYPKRELDPYYEKAHAFFEIGPYTYNVNDWKHCLPEIDIPLFPPDHIVETKIFQFAKKELLYHKYREVIDRAKNVITYINATVLNIDTNESGREVSGLQAGTIDGRRFRFQAGRYILAAGGIEIPRLLLLSNNLHRNGLANEYDNVGRYFMEHPHIWTGYIIPANVDLFNKINLYKVHNVNNTAVMGKFTISADLQRQEKLLNFTTSIHPSNMFFVPDGVLQLKKTMSNLKRGRFSRTDRKQLSYALRKLPNVFTHAYRKLRRTIDRGFRHRQNMSNVLLLNPMTEQIPNPESRVTLGPERDLFGQNRVHLNWQLTSQDINSIRRSQNILGTELKKYGIGELVIELADDSIPHGIHGGWHHMGTTRMDNDPKKGVVDQNCRVHGLSNLFVAGASVFPTVGYANPVLTTVALTMRLADHLIEQGESYD